MKRLFLVAAAALCVPAIAASPFEIETDFLRGVSVDVVLASRAYVDTAAFTDPVLGDVDIECAGAGYQPPDVQCQGSATRVDLEVLGTEIVGYTPHTGDGTLHLAVTADGEGGWIFIEPNPSP